MGQVSEKISKEQGKGLVCNVAADILNRTGRFRIVHAVFSLLDGTGRKIEKSAEFSLADRKFMRLALPIAPLEEGAYTFVEEIAKEKVEYIEVRFAPMLSVHENLSCRQVIEAVRKGMERGKEVFQVRYGIIVCAMRNHSEEQNLAMLKCAREYLGEGVCALDLAGDESAYPTAQYRNIFREAKRLGMPYTIHSGETGNLENVREAWELGAARIGHGIALKKDPELMKSYAKAGIGVEMCPTSNFQTKAVKTWLDYPLRQFLDAGIKVSVNTDNRTVSGTTMTRELTKVYEQYGREEELIFTLLRNAAETAFDPEIKEIFEKKWKGI